jgi:hypothetical protein
MTTRLGKTSIVVVRAPLVLDTRDNSYWRDWDNAVRTTLNNCMVEPFPLAEKLNFEINKDREFSQSAIRVYTQADADVIYTDRLEYDGYSWQVLGHPGLWVDLRNNRNHKAVIAQIRQG